MDQRHSEENTHVHMADPFQKLIWQFAVENSNIGVWDWDNRTGEDKVFYSKESIQFLGFDKDEKVFGTHSQDWNNRVHPDDKAKYFQAFQDHLNGLCPIYVNEHRVRCNDDRYKWILDRGKIIERDAEGNPTRVIGTHTDITDRIEYQEYMSRTLDLITKQNKKLRNFAHIVTHNLKEHSGNFESLLNFYDEASSPTDKEELINYLKVLSTSLKKTISNLNQIVSVQAKKEISVEKVYISKYVSRAIDLLDGVISQSKASINNLIDPELFIHFSPAYIESIIQNLMSNAIKYKHPERDPIITLTSAVNKHHIILKIADNGLGIDLEKFGSEIFGLYKTFHQNQNSEGVGLYLVKSQVESFGGKIEIASTVNVGTTFTITMPNKKIQFS